MARLSPFNQSFNPADGVRRHHRKHNGRPLVAGAGKVVANGKLKVELTTIDGDTVTYIAVPTMTWRYELDTTAHPKVVNRVMAPATPGDRVRRALDAALDEIVNLEKRARAASPATPITITDIAAE